MRINGDNMKMLVESLGTEGFTRKMGQLLEAKKIKPEQFSIREMWEAMIGDVHKTLRCEKTRQGFVMMNEQAINTTQFSNLTGFILSATMIEGYEDQVRIGNRLVRNVPSSQRIERVAGMTALSAKPLEVAEGQKYKEAEGLKDKFVTTKSTKKGRILSITEEAIKFDETGQLLDRARGIGEVFGREKEKLIINAVTGQLDNVYNPGGVDTTIFSDANKNIKYANGLVDWKSIDEAEEQFNEFKDENGDPINVAPTQILCSTNQRSTAKRIVNATRIVTKTDSANTETESVNPVGDYEILASPFVNAISKTKWWFGEFMRQYRWQDIWPLQIFQRNGQDHQEGWERDVVTQFKGRYYGGVYAPDIVYVVENTTEEAPE